MQGIDLATDPRTRSQRHQQVYSEEDHEGNVLWSLRTSDMKLISANADNPRGLPERALFDLSKDPNELDNLHGKDEAVETELAQHADLQKRAAEGEAVMGGGIVELSREECEQLKNLGYMEDCSHIN